MGYILRNARYELYAQGVASGLSRLEAYNHAGFKGKSDRAFKRVDANPHVQRRISELLAKSAAKSELSRREILDRVFQDWELARKLGQVASALKAGELMGRELHRMFTERKEIGGPGDFDNKSEDELRDMIKKDLEELGWEDGEITSIPSNTIN